MFKRSHIVNDFFSLQFGHYIRWNSLSLLNKPQKLTNNSIFFIRTQVKNIFVAHLVLKMFQSFKKDQFEVDFAPPGQTFMHWGPTGLVCYNTL